MDELQPSTRRLLARLLDHCSFRSGPHQPNDRGDVWLDAEKALVIIDVPRSSWVELIALTGKPDDAYDETGQRVGRVIGTVGGVPVIDGDG